MNNTKLSDEHIERLMDELLTVLQTLSTNKQHLRLFLRDLLSPAEYRDTALRWRIVNLLHKDVTQREIADTLGVSLAKITRGSRVLTHGSGGFAHVLKGR